VILKTTTYRMLLLTIALITLTGCDGDIDRVKDGFMPMYSKSLTVDQALSSWSNKEGCTNTSWNKYTSDRGEKFVQFTCEIDQKNVEVINQEDQVFKNDLRNAKIIFNFVLSASDKSFTKGPIMLEYTFKDNKKYTEQDHSDNIMESYLAGAYADRARAVIIYSRAYNNRK
jgi:hypothetical protein